MRTRRFSWLGMTLLLLIPAPLIIVFVVSFSDSPYIVFPPNSYSFRWYIELFTSPKWMKAFFTSAIIALGAAVVTTIVAFLAALALHRGQSGWKSSFELLILMPLIFPHAALGVGFMTGLLAIGMNGTMLGLLLVHMIICGPFAYRPIAISLEKMDPELVEAAMSLGADSRTAVRRVVLPLLKPGLVTSLLFSFIISFDEITISMFLVSPDVMTLPVSIYSHVHDAADPIVAAISSLLIVLTVLIVVAVERYVGLEVFVSESGSAGQEKKASGKVST